VTSLALEKHHPFRIVFSFRNRKHLGNDKSGEYGGDPKAVTLCLARYFLTTNNWCVTALSCRRCHVQIFVKNTVNGSNWYSYFCWYLLNSISSVTSHSIAHTWCFHYLSKLMVVCSKNCHWHMHGHHKNIYSTSKPVFSSLLPYHMLLQVFIMFLKEICLVKQNFMFTHCYVANMLNCDKPTICRGNQTADS
jgi:hypothetical protein